MSKPVLWLIIASCDRPDVHLALATTAWMAREAGVACECYLEAQRDGLLFSRSGSTVLGGQHHQQFNWLCCVFDVRCVLLGPCAVFRSSIALFHLPVIAEADELAGLYAQLLLQPGVRPPDGTLLAPTAPLPGGIDIGPYLYPDIVHRRALAFAPGGCPAPTWRLHVDPVLAPQAEEIDAPRPGDGYAELTLRIAKRWRARARAVAFGDPALMRGRIPAHVREDRLALYAPVRPLAPHAVRVSAYAERRSEVCEATAELALALGDPVLVGRQTGDGDVRHWSSRGVTIKVTDPNRPAFPIVETVAQAWSPPVAPPDEPDDAQLGRWADQGAVLTALLWHSGIMSHNDAMLNVLDLAASTGVRMGAGVMAARYETCPQLWELLQMPPTHGGVQGIVEPLLYAGGIGSLWEVECPPARLAELCRTALARIRAIAGEAGVPRGYYGYMNCDLGTLLPGDPAVFRAVEAAGLEYAISTELPGRNLVCYESDRLIALNQTPRAIASATPFIRITTVEDLHEAPRHGAGWILAALDAPVIAYDPYIWRHGSRFMQIIDWITRTPGIVSATPRTIARYARVLRQRGLVPEASEFYGAQAAGTASAAR